jgi:hypothetical protein
VLGEGKYDKANLDRYLVDGFPDHRRHEKHGEWDLQVPARYPCQVE